MKKQWILPLAAIGVGLVLFNVIAFVVPHAWSASFWVGYAFVTVAILAQVLSLKIAFDRESDLELMFLGLSIVQIGALYLGLQLVAGLVCMFVPGIPTWVAVVVSAVLLAGYALATISAVAGTQMVTDLGEQVQAKTFFIRSLTVDLENLGARIDDSELKQAVGRLRDSVRYSDPMSAEQLAEAEERIAAQMRDLERYVSEGDREAAVSLCAELELTVAERNRRCKMLK